MNWYRVSFFSVILILISGIVYVPYIHGAFIWDDILFIQENNLIKSWDNIPAFINQDYFRLSHELSYRPVSGMFHLIIYKLSGSAPISFRLANLVFHLINAFFVFLIFNKLIKNKLCSFAGSILFALHPVHTEIIQCASFNEDILAVFFMLLTFFFYLKVNSDDFVKNRLWIILSFIFFFLALFSKESAIVMPLIIGLHYYLTEREFKVPGFPGYFVITVFYLWIRFFVMVNLTAPQESYLGGSIYINFLTMCKGFMQYISILFYPVNLCVDYGKPLSLSVTEPAVIISFIVIAFYFLITYISKKYSVIYTFLLLWFPIGLLPVLNIVPFGNYISVRYLYFPSIGIFLLVSFFLKRWISSARLFLLFITTAVCLLSILTISRNEEWKNEEQLWKSNIQNCPYSIKAYKNLGAFYEKNNRIKESLKIFNKLLTMNPADPVLNSNIGLLYNKSNQIDLALKYLLKAVSLDPKCEEAQNNLGVIYQNNGNYKEARKYFLNALKANSYYAPAYDNLGLMLRVTGNYEKAIEMHQNAIKCDPGIAVAYFNMGVIYSIKDDFVEAEKNFIQSLIYNFSSGDTHNALGILYAKHKMYNKAVEEFSKVLEFDKSMADIIKKNLKRLHKQMGKK